MNNNDNNTNVNVGVSSNIVGQSSAQTSNQNQNTAANTNVSPNANVNVNQTPVNNAPTNNNVAQAQPPEQEIVITPIINEINTSKKQNSNTPFFIVLFLIAICVLFSDKIINFVTNGELNIGKNNTVSSNLVNGYIKINDKDNYMTSNNIKFYNFRTSTDSILLNYMPSKNITNVSKLNIYIELYNSNEELIDIIKFTPEEELEDSIISVYTIKLDNYISKNAYYAKINTRTEITNNTLTCTKVINNDNMTMTYKDTFNFDFYDLKTYLIENTLEYKVKTIEVNKYIEDIKNIKTNLDTYNINSNYEENSISYAIDLTTVKDTYKPLYNISTNYYYIKNDLTNKGWTCK